MTVKINELVIRAKINDGESPTNISQPPVNKELEDTDLFANILSINKIKRER